MSVQRTLFQLLRYGMTGGLAAVVDLGGFSILCPAFLPIAPAATISFLLAAVVNYLLTARFVFKQKAGARRFVKFLAFAIVGLLLNVSVTVLVAYLSGWPPPLAKAIGIGAAFLFNFWLNSVFVFAGPASDKALAQEVER